MASRKDCTHTVVSVIENGRVHPRARVCVRERARHRESVREREIVCEISRRFLKEKRLNKITDNSSSLAYKQNVNKSSVRGLLCCGIHRGCFCQHFQQTAFRYRPLPKDEEGNRPKMQCKQRCVERPIQEQFFRNVPPIDRPDIPFG